MNILKSSISKFLNIKYPLKRDDEQQKDFLQDIGLLIVKDHLPF
jgi:hypothetical protein